MTQEEFFDTCILDIVGVDVNEYQTVYTKRFGDRMRWVATLDKTAKAKMLWVNWDVFYLPMIDFFKMEEKDITVMLTSKMNVDLIGFMPSVKRLLLQDPSVRLLAESKEELEEIKKKLNAFK